MAKHGQENESLAEHYWQRSTGHQSPSLFRFRLHREGCPWQQRYNEIATPPNVGIVARIHAEDVGMHLALVCRYIPDTREAGKYRQQEWKKGRC